ncbi:MAG: hypothetical protein V4674_01335 [Patescibacteria group bacterium]
MIMNAIQNGAQSAVRFASLPTSFFDVISDGEEIETGVATHGRAIGVGAEAVRLGLDQFLRVGIQGRYDEALWEAIYRKLDLPTALTKLAEQAMLGFSSASSWWINAHVFTTGTVSILRWDGAATTGRWFQATVDAETLEVTLEWDTATGRESSFMGLPSRVVENRNFTLVDIVRDVHIEEDRTSPFALLANY